MTALRRFADTLARIPGGRIGKWIVLIVWVLLMAGFGSLAGKLQGAEQNQASAWLPGSAESTRVVNVANNFQSDNLVPAVVVYERDSGITPADFAKATADVAAIKKISHVTDQVVGPIPAKDGKALEAVVYVDMGADGWNALGPAVTSMLAQTQHGDPGLNSYVTGPAGVGADQSSAFKGIDGVLLDSTIAVVVILLLITYRSPLLWLLPLASSGIALAVTMGVVYLLAAHAGLVVNAESQGILLVLVMGAGTDYALLLIARYREELRRHEDRHEAMAVALHRAGPAILASATTVGLGMLCLTAADLNSTKGLGPVAAIGVVVALLSMVTLLPALLTIFGRWFFWPLQPKAGTPDPAKAGVWARIGTGIGKRPRTVWIGTALVLGALAVCATGLKADGLTTAQTFTNKPQSIVGQTVVDEHFPAGAGSPVVVIAKAQAATQARQTLAAVPDIGSVTQPVVKNGYAYIQGTLSVPADSQQAYDTVNAARTAEHAIPGADALVGGNTAVVLDTERAAQHDDKVIIPLVLLVVLVVLALLLRALVAPLLLMATVVLSFGAALGLSTVFFDHVFHFGAQDGSFPLLTFVFLVALGIDYNIFLMTRVREEAAVHGTKTGARFGLAATGGVITSAGIILAGTFAVLGTLPVVSFAEVGFAVSVGVLLDTFIVRSILVSALAMDIGDKIWWPGRLARGGANRAGTGADAQRETGADAPAEVTR